MKIYNLILLQNAFVMPIGIAEAQTKPTYLVCSLALPSGYNGSMTMKFALDEATRTVTSTFPTGVVKSSEAYFSAATVNFNDSAFLWEIDRSTLNAQAQATIRNQKMGPVLHGTCLVQKAPARAF